MGRRVRSGGPAAGRRTFGWRTPVSWARRRLAASVAAVTPTRTSASAGEWAAFPSRPGVRGASLSRFFSAAENPARPEPIVGASPLLVVSRRRGLPAWSGCFRAHETPRSLSAFFFCGGTLLRRGASAHRRGNLGRPGRIGALRRSPCPGRRYPRWMTLPGERYPRPKRKIYICRRVSRTERMGTALRVAPVEGLTPCCPEPISYVDRNQTGSCSCPVAVFSEARGGSVSAFLAQAVKPPSSAVDAYPRRTRESAALVRFFFR